MIAYMNEILNANKIFIYGAGLMGKTLMKCLTSSTYSKEIDAFIVNDMHNNPHNIESIPVIEIENAKKLKDELILVALHEKNIYPAITDLKQRGFSKIIPVSFDSDLWTALRSNWMQDLNVGYSDDIYEIGRWNNDVTIFVVHSSADRVLEEKHVNKSFEKSIQVGAALTSKKMCEIRDNIGINISTKNREYCELTAIYWIWKNYYSKYVGISHYRRVFDLSEYQIGELVGKDVDVVVTSPMICLKTIKEQYAIDHYAEDWNIAIDAINEIFPEYNESADKIQNGHFYYAYNMFIAKKEIFNDYCDWLFKILEYCENKITRREDNYQKRYAGFLAERLLTIYLDYHKEFKLVIAKKHFIEK